jgi:hypothetical protein
MERDKEKRVQLERRRKRAKKRSYDDTPPSFDPNKRSHFNGRNPNHHSRKNDYDD